MSFTPPPAAAPVPPEAPSRDDTDTGFDEKANALVAWYAPFVVWLTAFVGWITTFLAEITTAIADIDADRVAAQTAANIANGASNFKGDWALQVGAMNIPATVAHNGRTWMLKENVANVALEQPGVSSKWAAYDIVLPLAKHTGTAATIVNYTHNIIQNVAATTLQFPPTPAEGSMVWVTVSNSLPTNVMARNGSTIEGIADDMQLDEGNGTYFFRYIDSTWRRI